MIVRILSLFLFISFAKIQSQPNTKELIDSLSSINDHQKKVDLSRKIALQLQTSDWDRAIKYIQLAEAESKNTQHPETTLASVYITAAKMYSSKEVFDIAFQYYIKAYDILKKSGKTEETANVENNLAMLYAQGKNKNKALQYFFNVYHYQKSKKNPVKLLTILNNIGTLYLEINPDSSLYYCKKAYLINKTIDNPTLKVYVCTNLARAYALKKDQTKTLQYYDEAFSFENKVADKQAKAFVYESFSEYCIKEKKYDLGILNAKKALVLYDQNVYTFSGLNIHKLLYKAYINKEDYKNAVYHFQKYGAISDSINVEEKAINLERIKLEQDYKVSNQIKALVEEKERFKYYAVSMILVAGILILLILLLKYHNKNTKTQLEKEKLKTKMHSLKQNLDTKNKALISKAMSEIHRADGINEILNDLKKIKVKTSNKDLKQAINIVLNRLEKNLNTDIWKEFEISFEQVHKSFFNKLISTYPSLTPKDRRLCALLYLDLSTKEISQITGHSDKSIENARTRLRKKFDLTNEKVNLSTYLNTF